jgi:5-methylcytosine-specific restriction endonuclease McrA
MALSRKTPLKRSGTLSRESSKLSGGGPIKRKQKTQAEKDQQSADIERMRKLFEEHWEKKPHKCEQCGTGIWGENKTLYHHHLLPKGLDRYEHLKYEYSNLMMLCWQCHANVDSNPGDKVIERTEQAHKQFGV